MHKILSLALLGAAVFSSAQIKLSGKANLLFKTDQPTLENIIGAATTAYSDSGKNSVGYNIGLSAKINLPVTSLFLMPEVYYTSFTTDFDIPAKGTNIVINSNRVDVPVLLGYNLLGDNFGVFVGPVASYNLAKEEQYDDFRENARKNFTLGYQFGAQAQINKLIINARYEGAFTKDQRNFISSQTDETIRYDSRPSLLIVGLGYQF